MRSHLSTRSSSAGIWLAIPILMSVTVLAESSHAFPIQTIASTVEETSPSSGNALEELSPEEQGDLLVARGNYAAAIGAYQGATLTSARVWNKIGVAYHHLFAFQEARKAYQTALVIDPHNAAALNNLAAVYHVQKDFGEAERLYKRALKYGPNSAVTYCNLGTSYFAEAKYKKGMIAYRMAFSLDHNVFDPGQAAEVEAAATRQERLAINYYLAKTYAGAGQKERALIYLRKAIDEGFNDRKRLMEDKEFALLRETPEFHQLLVEEHMN